jgi:glycosyltransferase involved in cell wall biosynthesis
MNSKIKLALVTDAWKPQVNGVCTTLGKTCDTLRELGHEVHVINPNPCKTMPCPTYPEIRLVLQPFSFVKKELENFQPTHIHIATEGPLGFAARRYCVKNRLSFTSSYHTQFPEYIRKRYPLPLSLSYKFFRWFHGASTRLMIGAPAQRRLLEARGFKNIVYWTKGVDTDLFKPGDKSFLSYERPIWVYLGRVAIEKNIESFLSLDLPGTKVIIGDGPAKEELSKKYPQIKFEGYRFGEELVRYLGAGDVFVFPSLTDTFGLVMLEAMACGLPIAAYPVTGPIDVVRDGETGCLNEDLKEAALCALKLNPEDCLKQANEYTWKNATLQFIDNLVLAKS